MKLLKETFEKSFSMPFPEIWSRKDLFPFGEKGEEALLYGSKIALKKPYLVQGDIPQFIKSCPQGYFLVGFWGHGVNSYAFYYSLVDSWRKVFFRLPYGGCYTDNKKHAKLIRKFLTSYMTWEEEIKNNAKRLIATDLMYEGYYEVLCKNGRIYETRESFFREPQFEKIFECLFKR